MLVTDLKMELPLDTDGNLALDTQYIHLCGERPGTQQNTVRKARTIMFLSRRARLSQHHLARGLR